MSDIKTAEAEKAASSSGDLIARTTAILAVIAALASARWGACNLQAILEQGKVNDTWALYQAKSIKQHEAEQTRELARSFAAGRSADGAAAMSELVTRMDSEAKREEAEKAEQKVAAEEFQFSRDRMVESSFWFELAFAGLQLGVILCTIAAGRARKLPWMIGVAVGLVGTLLLINGWHRFVHAPKAWYQGVSGQMSYEVKPAAPTATEH